MSNEYLPVRAAGGAARRYQGRSSARHQSPDDTRYPTPALIAGLGSAGGIVGLGAAFSLLAAPVGIAIVGALAAGVGWFIGSTIKFADQWEKAVVLRLGRYRGLRGPGVFFVIPIVDRISYHIDQRIRTTDFGAESCLTKDTVPVNVDAIASRHRPRCAMRSASMTWRNSFSQGRSWDEVSNRSSMRRCTTGASRCSRWRSVM
jgi:hypothetical protein